MEFIKKTGLKESYVNNSEVNVEVSCYVNHPRRLLYIHYMKINVNETRIVFLEESSDFTRRKSM